MPCKLRLQEKVAAVSLALDDVEDTIVDCESLNTCKVQALHTLFFIFFPPFFTTLSKRG